MEKNEMVIDGENAVLGRLASFSAKQILQGNTIIIVNSEKVIITGNKANVLAKYLEKRARGGSSQSGPYFSANPEKILKRTIRGMMDYKRGRGREGFKKLRCYIGIPKEYQDKKIIKSARGAKGIQLGELSRILTGKAKQ